MCSIDCMAHCNTELTPPTLACFCANFAEVGVAFDVSFSFRLDVDTCMTRALRRAEVRPEDIQAHARAMAREGIDEKLLQPMDFGTANRALQSAGIRVWSSRRRIFMCFSSGTECG